MKIIDRIKQHLRLRSARRALLAGPLSDTELQAFWKRWAETADKDASRHAEFTPWGTSPLACLYDWDYSGLPPLGNTDRRERLLSLARQAGVPRGTPGILEFAELVAADATKCGLSCAR